MFKNTRQVAKTVAEWALVSSGLPGAARLFYRDSSAILVYHNIVPDDASPVGDRSLHLPRKAFAAQLDLLDRTHRIVSLDEFVDAPPVPATGSRPKALVTFDDAYRGAVKAGLEELRFRNLPCTIFVAPERLGDQSFWWDEVAEGLGRLDSEARAEVLRDFEGRQVAVRRWMAQRGIERPTLPEHARSVTEAELAEAVTSSMVTIGSHTWSHPYLPQVALASQREVGEELAESRQWLSEHFPDAFRPWLAYPYGEASAAVLEQAASTGYEQAVVVGGGMCKPGMLEDRSWMIPRITIPAGLSFHGFELRTAGVFLPSRVQR